LRIALDIFLRFNSKSYNFYSTVHPPTMTLSLRKFAGNKGRLKLRKAVPEEMRLDS